MGVHNLQNETTDNRRSWLLVAAWFGTIALVGVLKRVLERQQST